MKSYLSLVPISAKAVSYTHLPCRIFFTPFLELNYYITSVLGKKVSKRHFSSPYM